MVKPVAVADNLAKTQAAERVTQIDKAAPEMDQKQFAAELTKRLNDKQQKPSPTAKTDEVVIHREKQKNDEQKKKKKKDREKEKKSSHLDVKA